MLRALARRLRPIWAAHPAPPPSLFTAAAAASGAVRWAGTTHAAPPSNLHQLFGLYLEAKSNERTSFEEYLREKCTSDRACLCGDGGTDGPCVGCVRRFSGRVRAHCQQSLQG